MHENIIAQSSAQYELFVGYPQAHRSLGCPRWMATLREIVSHGNGIKRND